MRRGILLTFTALALVLSFGAVSAADSHLMGEQPLFSPIKTVAPDFHIEGMDNMGDGPAVPPEGAPSHGEVIGVTSPGTARVAGTSKALVSVNGEANIQGPGGPIDDFSAGAGYRADFPMLAVSQIQLEIITQQPVEIEVEAFFLGNSLAKAQRIYIDGTNNFIRWGTRGVFFDRIEVRAVRDSPGFGLDNIGVGGMMASRPVVCRDTSFKVSGFSTSLF